MNNKVVIEVSGGNIIALHADSDLDFHIVDWDNRAEDVDQWENGCRQPLSPDRYIDKGFSHYMNEVLNA